jgi:hypothetical protein
MKTIKYRITLTEPMLGTVPKNKELHSTFIASKISEVQGVEETENVEDLKERGYTGFMSDDKGLFVYDYLFRGFLKNSANVLKDNVKIKALKSKLTNYVFVTPRKIYLGKTKPDGVLERSLRADTPMGLRVTLTKSDYVSEGTAFDIEITFIPHKEVNEEVVEELLGYGKFQGLGQWRNASYGRFSFEKLEDNSEGKKAA